MKNKDLLKKIGNEITTRLINLYGKKVKSIILYGSYARGDNDDQSDMDIMVLFDCPYEEVIGYRHDISKVASRVGLENDMMVSIVFRNIKSFDTNYKILPIYQNVVEEGKTLYGTI